MIVTPDQAAQVLAAKLTQPVELVLPPRKRAPARPATVARLQTAPGLPSVCPVAVLTVQRHGATFDPDNGLVGGAWHVTVSRRAIRVQATRWLHRLSEHGYTTDPTRRLPGELALIPGGTASYTIRHAPAVPADRERRSFDQREADCLHRGKVLRIEVRDALRVARLLRERNEERALQQLRKVEATLDEAA